MLRIVTHIERLLLVHDCVIVPKFGGFVLQAVPAMQHKEEHTFRPLRKEIGFNMTLQHNDGLLPESYMQMHEVSYRQAQLMLEEDVEDIKNILQQYGKLSLGVQCRLVWLACFPFPGSRSTRDGTRRSGSSCIPKREERYSLYSD